MGILQTFLQCAVEMEWRAAGEGLVLLIDRMKLTGYRAWSSFFAACTLRGNVLQQSHLNDIYTHQIPGLSVSPLYLCPNIGFCANIPPSNSLLLSLFVSLFYRPGCCRALTEKKHSEIWHWIIMPQTCTCYHSPLLPSAILILWLSVLLGILTRQQLMSGVCSLSTLWGKEARCLVCTLTAEP